MGQFLGCSTTCPALRILWFPIQQIECIDSDWRLDADPNVTLHPHNGLWNNLLCNLVAFINTKEGIPTHTCISNIKLCTDNFTNITFVTQIWSNYCFHCFVSMFMSVCWTRKNTISFRALFLLHRAVWAGWSMLMLAYNAHCMLIQCSQKVFIKFASRRYDDTPSPPPSDADVHLRFWPAVL